MDTNIFLIWVDRCNKTVYGSPGGERITQCVRCLKDTCQSMRSGHYICCSSAPRPAVYYTKGTRKTHSSASMGCRHHLYQARPTTTAHNSSNEIGGRGNEDMSHISNSMLKFATRASSDSELCTDCTNHASLKADQHVRQFTSGRV